MTTVSLDRFLGSNLSNIFSKPKNTNAISNVVADQLPSPTSLVHRGLKTAYSIVTTDQVSNQTKIGVLAVSSLVIPRLFTSTNPMLAAVTMLGFIVYKLGQFLAGKVSLQGILNFLNAAKKISETTSKNEGPQIEEIVEETPENSNNARSLTKEFLKAESQILPQAPTKKKFSIESFKKFEEKENMVDEFLQTQPTSQASVMVRQYEQFNATKDLVEEYIQTQASVMADEFVALNSNPALQRAQVIQSQTKTQEKTDKPSISKENAKQLYLQFLAQQQAKRGKAKL